MLQDDTDSFQNVSVYKDLQINPNKENSNHSTENINNKLNDMSMNSNSSNVYYKKKLSRKSLK